MNKKAQIQLPILIILIIAIIAIIYLRNIGLLSFFTSVGCIQLEPSDCSQYVNASDSCTMSSAKTYTSCVVFPFKNTIINNNIIAKGQDITFNENLDLSGTIDVSGNNGNDGLWGNYNCGEGCPHTFVSCTSGNKGGSVIVKKTVTGNGKIISDGGNAGIQSGDNTKSYYCFQGCSGGNGGNVVIKGTMSDIDLSVSKGNPSSAVIGISGSYAECGNIRSGTNGLDGKITIYGQIFQNAVQNQTEKSSQIEIPNANINNITSNPNLVPVQSKGFFESIWAGLLSFFGNIKFAII